MYLNITIKSLKPTIDMNSNKVVFLLYFETNLSTEFLEFTEKIAKDVYHESN
jgi:hypothetical protein